MGGQSLCGVCLPIVVCMSALADTQWWGRGRYQTSRHQTPGSGGLADTPRRISRHLVTAQDSKPGTTTAEHLSSIQTRKVLQPFEEMFPDPQTTQKARRTAKRVSIDPGKFKIIAAVPGVEIIQHEARGNKAINPGQTGQTGLTGHDASVFIPDKFSPVPAVPLNLQGGNTNSVAGVGQIETAKDTTEARTNKAIDNGRAASVFVPSKFNPVQAVPLDPIKGNTNYVVGVEGVEGVDRIEAEKSATEKYVEKVSFAKSAPVSENFIQSKTAKDTTEKPVEEVRVPTTSPVSVNVIQSNFISVKEKRKKFKRCHGRCVQKFCLPVGLLSVFEKCSEKCRGICS